MIAHNDALSLIANSHRHIARATLTNGNITISSAQLIALSIAFDFYGADFIEVNASATGLGRHNFAEWDMRQAPCWQIQFEVEFPDLGERARLDPLRLVGRKSKITGVGLSHLTFHSAESLVRDAAAFEARRFDHTWNAASAIATIIRAAAPGERFHNALPATPFLDAGETLEWKDYRNPWAIVQEICELADAQCYHDGHGFRLEPATLEGQGNPFIIKPAMLTDFAFETDRDDFANAATIEFENVAASYEITTGAFAAVNIGRKMRYVRVPRIGGHGQAIARATAVAQRAVLEGLSASLTLSVLPLWLRPSHRVTVVDQELTGVISSITFDVLNAETTIRLTAIEGV